MGLQIPTTSDIVYSFNKHIQLDRGMAPAYVAAKRKAPAFHILFQYASQRPAASCDIARRYAEQTSAIYATMNRGQPKFGVILTLVIQSTTTILLQSLQALPTQIVLLQLQI